MFTVDPDKRPTALECQTHKWFKKNVLSHSATRAEEAISKDVLTGLARFHGKSRLRRECLQILVKMVNPREFMSLRNEFNKIDTNGSGTIEI